jgi:hypothetical protein
MKEPEDQNDEGEAKGQAPGSSSREDGHRACLGRRHLNCSAAPESSGALSMLNIATAD